MENKQRWVFFVDGMAFDGSFRGACIGGSEWAGLQLARALAARGHDVRVFAQCPKEGGWDGVRYHHIRHYIEWSTSVPHDVAVVQRVPHPLTLPLAAPVRLLWCHDLALKRNADAIRGILWSVDRLVVLSEFMKRQYQEVNGAPEAAFHVTRNGLDLELIASAPGPPARDPKALVFTARPERGMDVLLEETFPRLLRADPELRLYLSGYGNYVDFLRPLYEKCRALTDRFAGRVRHLGELDKRGLYQLYKTAALYVYPSDFEEISCITAMECMACGLPMVCGARGALPETLDPAAGAIVPYVEGKGARDPAYQEAFTEACLRLLRDGAAWTAASAAGVARARGLDWSGVAAEWEGLAAGLLVTEKEPVHV